MVYSGAWGKLIPEKNQKQKISPVPLTLIMLLLEPVIETVLWMRKKWNAINSHKKFTNFDTPDL